MRNTTKKKKKVIRKKLAFTKEQLIGSIIMYKNLRYRVFSKTNGDGNYLYYLCDIEKAL